jgi:hypothetical protein
MSVGVMKEIYAPPISIKKGGKKKKRAREDL